MKNDDQFTEVFWGDSSRNEDKEISNFFHDYYYFIGAIVIFLHFLYNAYMSYANYCMINRCIQLHDIIHLGIYKVHRLVLHTNSEVFHEWCIRCYPSSCKKAGNAHPKKQLQSQTTIPLEKNLSDTNGLSIDKWASKKSVS